MSSIIETRDLSEWRKITWMAWMAQISLMMEGGGLSE